MSGAGLTVRVLRRGAAGAGGAAGRAAAARVRVPSAARARRRHRGLADQHHAALARHARRGAPARPRRHIVARPAPPAARPRLTRRGGEPPISRNIRAIKFQMQWSCERSSRACTAF